jgi:hypothetical protein
MARVIWIAIAAGALASCWAPFCDSATSPQSPDPDPQPVPDSQALEEVTINARRPIDRATLEQVVIPRFVQSHASANPFINQVGRWRDDVCPITTGLQPAYNDFVTHRVLVVAQTVGAPTRGVGEKCAANVEIAFTPTPQGLVDHIAKTYPSLLGFYYAAQFKEVTTFSRPIQAWYVTATRTGDGVRWTDSQQSGPLFQKRHDLGSRLSSSLSSEFVHVFVIVDSNKVTGYSLQSVSDYIAMLALTRMASLDGCNELPSITDLLAKGCEAGVPPGGLTAADSAFLKALYSSDLAKNLNIERGSLHDRMVAVVEGSPHSESQAAVPPAP